MIPITHLSPDGTLVGDAPMEPSEAVRLYEALVTARSYDLKCSALQRQGRLATYAPYLGQEAAQIGAVAALRADDWLVGTYRDAAAMWMHGYTMKNLLLGRMGDERGGQAPEGVNVMPPSITVGAHMIHAVGLGWAERLQGRDRVALTMFGDGATSEGDFHEAMNFAAVFSTPTIYFCQNNGYAISMARAQQTASETIAQKATAYGMPGVLVDGNDLFAVFDVTRTAVERARRGDGPTLIEALTYRMGPHTTTDDPARYRSAEEAESWAQRDPLVRVRHYLEAEGLWSSADQDAAESAASRLIEDEVAAAESVSELGPDQMFDSILEGSTQQLDEQREFLARDS
ncbi:MAG: pyruvate dehydrogenase (acetyl-transferring) E1 component subunit alpha [Acidimicrobiia bacterium]|nr:pyruvate dehydrogenase (acetyl-transferring) E1 component subunit alpha [Acidimicrobiia bacterium]